MKGIAAAGLVVALVLPGAAWAQSDATRAAARELGAKGVEDFQAGSYPAANEKLSRAFEILRVPSLGLWSARALVKVGKLVEASERYVAVTRLDATSGDVAVQKQAKADAASEREALLPRIPSFTLSVKGASSAFALTLDGAPLPSALVGVEQPANPGRHVVQVQDGNRTQKREFTLNEGQRLPLELELTRAAPAPAAPLPSSAAVEAPAPVPTPAPAPATDHAAAGGGLPTGFWVGIAVTGAGLVTGGVSAGLAAKKKGEVNCPNNQCPPDQYAGADSYNNLLTVSTVGFVVAGVGAATAGYFLLTKPKKLEGTASVTPWLGLGSAGVQGAF